MWRTAIWNDGKATDSGSRPDSEIAELVTNVKNMKRKKNIYKLPIDLPHLKVLTYPGNDETLWIMWREI